MTDLDRTTAILPKRIQRSREKGWRAPLNALGRKPIYVGRPGKYGNPYSVQPVDKHGQYPFGWKVGSDPSVAHARYLHPTEAKALERSLELFQRYIEGPSWVERLEELRGRDLMCWCYLDQPCHADLLLVMANPGEVAP